MRRRFWIASGTGSSMRFVAAALLHSHRRGRRSALRRQHIKLDIAFAKHAVPSPPGHGTIGPGRRLRSSSWMPTRSNPARPSHRGASLVRAKPRCCGRSRSSLLGSRTVSFTVEYEATPAAACTSARRRATPASARRCGSLSWPRMLAMFPCHDDPRQVTSEIVRRRPPLRGRGPGELFGPRDGGESWHWRLSRPAFDLPISFLAGE